MQVNWKRKKLYSRDVLSGGGRWHASDAIASCGRTDGFHGSKERSHHFVLKEWADNLSAGHGGLEVFD